MTTRFIGFRFLSHIAQQTTFVMVPPLFLIFLVLGTIFIGVATPTEGGAMGAAGALILGGLKRRLNWDLIRQATESTAKLSAFVVFHSDRRAGILSLTFYGVSGHIWVENLLTSLPGGQVGFLIFVNAFVFVLAFFLDFFELAFIVIPLLGAGCRASWDRLDLVRGHSRREHADDRSCTRRSVCSVLSALGCSARKLYRPRHRQTIRKASPLDKFIGARCHSWRSR